MLWDKRGSRQVLICCGKIIGAIWPENGMFAWRLEAGKRPTGASTKVERCKQTLRKQAARYWEHDKEMLRELNVKGRINGSDME